jgi:carboxymethylenebutenolidase
VPDIYYRSGDWAPFDLNTAFGDPDERTRLMSMMGGITPDKMESDARAFFDYLAARPEVSGESFGTTGYCMGGRTSLVLAGRVPERVAAAMSFHGGGLASDDPGSPHLLADQMQAVVYVAGAENDQSFTPEAAEKLDKALTAADVEHTIVTYPAAHGFAVADHGAVYDEAAAARHWAAMKDFFGTHLT